MPTTSITAKAANDNDPDAAARNAAANLPTLKRKAMEQLAQYVVGNEYPAHPGYVERPHWVADFTSDNRGPLVFFKAAGSGEENDVVQIQPTADQIAAQTRDIVQYTHHLVVNHTGFGLKHYEITPRNLLRPSTKENLVAAAADTVQAMMGGRPPTPATFRTAEQLLLAHPSPAETIAPFRWQGETILAHHEIPQLAEGDWSAHREFIDRCSCRDTVMAWTYSCFVPEEQTGRECLVFFGHGNDGKTVWCHALMTFLGPIAVASEILKGDNRFALAPLVGKRLVHFGDVRNPRPFHSRQMRELISGAMLSFEEKGRPFEAGHFHPRCLIDTNVDPRIDINNPAEYTRVRRVNVAALKDNQGDTGWSKRLLEQMPAFLFECRKVYERMVTPGQGIPITQACHDALAGGTAEIEDEFAYLAARLEITGDDADVVTCARMEKLILDARYTGWTAKNAKDWLRSKGARNRAADGKTQLKIGPKNHRQSVWRGVREIADQVRRFQDIENA